MMQKILITKNIKHFQELKYTFQVGDYWIYTAADIYEQNGVKLIIDGFVLPRTNYYDEFRHLPQAKLIFDLYTEKGDQITSYLKGIFNIFIFKGNEIVIFNDHFALRKLFKYEQKDIFILSNDFAEVASLIPKLSINKIGIFENTLFNHYINGHTFIENLNYLCQANILFLKEDEIEIKTYWNYESLLQLPKSNRKFEDWATLVKTLVQQHLNYLQPTQTALSLTGGKDSRTLLASLLEYGVKPFSFTYGNSNTSDSYYAKKIANGTGLDYAIFSSNITTESLFQYYKKIIRSGNPLINIHRAHRLKAFEQVKQKTGENTCYFGGYLGGELLMGIYYDNLIFTNFIRELIENNNSDINEKIKNLLESHFVKSAQSCEISSLLNELHKMKMLQTQPKKIKQFNAIMSIGVLHHFQDVHLMMEKINYVIPFFIDIDFLQCLFSSNMSMLSVNNETKNIFKRNKLFSLNLMVQHIIYPALDKFYFAKKGSFNTKEYVSYRSFLPFIRLYRRFFLKNKFAQPVYYDQDYQKKILSELRILKTNSYHPIHQYFNIEKAITVLENKKLGSTEKYWHPFTNILTLAEQLKLYYKKTNDKACYS